jgi:ABC-type transport system involved in multi-copper enzyme maturation permease subunit
VLAGPIFTRETTTVPRQLRHFLVRAGYVAALFVLMYTADQAVFGWQQVRNIGDTARFGSLLFEIFSLVQLPLVLFFALIFCAGSIAQEKDRRTLLLLLMSDLTSRELVLGKLGSSLLIVMVLLGVSTPVFFLVHLLGGVNWEQIAWVLALCVAVAVAAGSWGAMVAFWREKTFQTLAIGVLGIVGFLGVVEATRAVAGDQAWVSALNPFRTLLTVLDPFARDRDPVALRSVVSLSGLGLVLISVTVWRLRIWNPSRVTYVQPEEETDDASGETRVRHRRIWSNPVIWREIRTRAYGRKVQLIKAAYLLLATAVVYLVTVATGNGLVLNIISPGGLAVVGLSLLSLLLINAQAVTALTSERDGKTLDLLLATDISAKEFIYGKLGGIAWNTRELIVVPLALAGWQAMIGAILWEDFVYLLVGFSMLSVFAAMLGLHSGLTFEASRTAIGNSLGTLFFLFIGIFVFLMLLVEASGSFASQLLSFIVFIGLGGIGLWASLTHKNPSPALTLAAGWLPFVTFYSITEFLREGTLSVCLAIVAVYGFTSLAMLVPAVSAFDVALGRTTGDRG